MKMVPGYNLSHDFLVWGPGANLWGEQLEGLWRGKDMEDYRNEIRDPLKPVTFDSRPSVPVGAPKQRRPRPLFSYNLELYEGVRSNTVWTLCSPQILIQAQVSEN